MTRLLTAVANWLSSHEYIAIWAEGIALVAIFIWDRLDSRAQHEQTIAQLQIAQEQAEASRNAAQSVINAERAWVMTYLDWWSGASSFIMENTSESRTEGRNETTTARLRVICENEGKTPAWIDNVYGQMEIIRTQTPRTLPQRDQMESFGPIGPLGAGKDGQRAMDLTCKGHRREHEMLSVYVLVEYHDIFGMNRETHLGYTIYDSQNMRREDALPNRDT